MGVVRAWTATGQLIVRYASRAEQLILLALCALLGAFLEVGMLDQHVLGLAVRDLYAIPGVVTAVVAFCTVKEASYYWKYNPYLRVAVTALVPFCDALRAGSEGAWSFLDDRSAFGTSLTACYTALDAAAATTRSAATNAAAAEAFLTVFRGAAREQTKLFCSAAIEWGNASGSLDPDATSQVQRDVTGWLQGANPPFWLRDFWAATLLGGFHMIAKASTMRPPAVGAPAPAAPPAPPAAPPAPPAALMPAPPGAIRPAYSLCAKLAVGAARAGCRAAAVINEHGERLCYWVEVATGRRAWLRPPAGKVIFAAVNGSEGFFLNTGTFEKVAPPAPAATGAPGDTVPLPPDYAGTPLAVSLSTAAAKAWVHWAATESGKFKLVADDVTAADLQPIGFATTVLPTAAIVIAGHCCAGGSDASAFDLSTAPVSRAAAARGVATVKIDQRIACRKRAGGLSFWACLLVELWESLLTLVMFTLVIGPLLGRTRIRAVGAVMLGRLSREQYGAFWRVPRRLLGAMPAAGFDALRRPTEHWVGLDAAGATGKSVVLEHPGGDRPVSGTWYVALCAFVAQYITAATGVAVAFWQLYAEAVEQFRDVPPSLRTGMPSECGQPPGQGEGDAAIRGMHGGAVRKARAFVEEVVGTGLEVVLPSEELDAIDADEAMAVVVEAAAPPPRGGAAGPAQAARRPGGLLPVDAATGAAAALVLVCMLDGTWVVRKPSLGKRCCHVSVDGVNVKVTDPRVAWWRVLLPTAAFCEWSAADLGARSTLAARGGAEAACAAVVHAAESAGAAAWRPPPVAPE